VYDRATVDKALGRGVKLVVAPFTGAFAKGNPYPTDSAYSDQVITPLHDWAGQHHVKIVLVTGLQVSDLDFADFDPSDLPELRAITAYQDVTSTVLGMINYLRTGAQHFPGPAATPVVPPTAAQLAALTAHLRAGRVYNAPGRTDPIDISTGLVTKDTGFTIRVAAFPAIGLGQPRVDYAPALARQFPGDEIFVNYGQWMEVAGPHLGALRSARDYAYGQYENATLEQGANMANRIGTIVGRTYELVRKHPFSRPQPTPFDVRHRISALAPWVLLGCAVLLGGGSLLAWQRRRAEVAARERTAFRRESALAAAAIAALGARLLDDEHAPAAAAERQATATTLFDQATTADAMREVRGIAEQGEELSHR
jgi:hypothetical protein